MEANSAGTVQITIIRYVHRKNLAWSENKINFLIYMTETMSYATDNARSFKLSCISSFYAGIEITTFQERTSNNLGGDIKV